MKTITRTTAKQLETGMIVSMFHKEYTITDVAENLNGGRIVRFMKKNSAGNFESYRLVVPAHFRFTVVD